MSFLSSFNSSKQTLPVNYNELTPQMRRLVREQYVSEQNGLCHHCKQPLTQLPVELIKSHPVNKELFPKSMFNYPIHLHHCHDSGITIGAVHAHCNAILWQYHGE